MSSIHLQPLIRSRVAGDDGDDMQQQQQAGEAVATTVLEEPPSILWGLDPAFCAFSRLYVCDILTMKESCQVTGIYLYNSHPIYRVDVLGTVVYKKEREDFFCYGVDDGTGVINCLCWKNEQWTEQGDLGKPEAAGEVMAGGSAAGGFNPVTALKALKQAQLNSSRLEIGELLRVRGTLKTSRRSEREIMASTYYKVNDPVMAAQIAWMMEAPRLYRECYDIPFVPQTSTGASVTSRLGKATGILKNFLNDNAVSRFRTLDVVDLLQPLFPNEPQAASTSCQEPVAGPSVSQQLRQLLQEALQILQDEGCVFIKVKSQDKVYHVTEQDKDLLMATKDIIREDSRREKYAEKGCHILHILSAVRQRYSCNVSKAALELVLRSLEYNSDIISTSDNYYTMI